jgi:hypothetical protein
MNTDSTRRVPRGTPAGGRFATASRGRAQVALADDPHLATARAVGQRHVDRHGDSDASLTEEVYGGLMRSWAGPPISEEARVEALRAGRLAIMDARRAATAEFIDEPNGGKRGELAYLGMRPTLGAVAAGTYSPSRQVIESTAREVATRRLIANLLGAGVRPDPATAETQLIQLRAADLASPETRPPYAHQVPRPVGPTHRHSCS